MNANRRWILLGLAAAIIAVSGCGTTSAPDAWQSTAQAMQREAYGSWIGVTLESAPDSLALRGELIAVSADTLFVLPLSRRLQAVPRSSVADTKLTTFDANWGYLSTWTALGTLSTLSHGLVLALSAPVWLIAGSISSAVQSHKPIIEDPNTDALRRYARFPQGLPAAVDRETLTAKPTQ
jgi:hypothetical protein